MRIEYYKKELRKSWPPPGIDPGCIDLCGAINKIPGIVTIESCEGNNKYSCPYMIFFKAEHLGVLPPLLYWLDRCHSGFSHSWGVKVSTDCGCSPVTFMIEGPVDKEIAIKESKYIAERILEDLKSNKKDYRDRYLKGLKSPPSAFLEFKKK
jgi:hypothetical protein